jgi:hypothetical protein
LLSCSQFFKSIRHLFLLSNLILFPLFYFVLSCLLGFSKRFLLRLKFSQISPCFFNLFSRCIWILNSLL